MSRVLDETYSQIKKVENQIGFELEGTREALEKLELELEDWASPPPRPREEEAFEIARRAFPTAMEEGGQWHWTELTVDPGSSDDQLRSAGKVVEPFVNYKGEEIWTLT